MKVLGIETSCDDTSICLLEVENGVKNVLSFKTFGQEDSLIHWGGVVPEIASRNHQEKITPLLKYILENSNSKLGDIDLIGVTTLPGLLGPLLTGVNLAKSISLIHKTPILPVNHLYAHLEAVHLDQSVKYPYLGILISGGHSIFMQVTSAFDFKVLGSTIDDAAGEAFDKGGRLLGLPYPSGRIIDEICKKIPDDLIDKNLFPVGLHGSKDCRLSYSGLKTSLKNFIEKNPNIKNEFKKFAEHYLKNSILESSLEFLSQDSLKTIASYQHAIAKALGVKLKFAIEKALENGHKGIPIVMGGGVACNSYIRKHLQAKYPKESFHFVTPKYCTDNGAMIANLAFLQKDRAISFPETLDIDARGRFISKTLPRDLAK